MEMDNKYDPEDIESLMIHKTFEELLDKEKQFVLQHLESSDEYDSMRNLLLGLDEYGDDQIVPPSRIKDSLMSEFERKAKLPFWKVWLNSIALFLVPPERSFVKSPAFALTLIAVLFGGVLTFMAPSDTDNLAHTAEVTEPKNLTPTDERPKSEKQTLELEEAEISNQTKDVENTPELISEDLAADDKKALRKEEVVLAEKESSLDLDFPEETFTLADADQSLEMKDDYKESSEEEIIELKRDDDLAFDDYESEESVDELTVTISAPATNATTFDLADIQTESLEMTKARSDEESNILSKKASESENLMDLLYTSL